MTKKLHNHVGAPDPTLKNSPILDEDEDIFPGGAGEQDEHPACYFNGVLYPEGDLICSGSAELLRCECGAWVREGSCDQDNP
ncbi:MAG: hypothetical protein ABFS23_05885 [Pseudomonadota bacterium]